MGQKMKKLSTTLVLVAIAACSKKAPMKPISFLKDAPSHVPAELIVKTSKIDAFKAKNPGLTVESVAPALDLYLVSGESLKGQEDKIASNWTSQGLIEFAEKNDIVHLSRTQDRYSTDLWGLKNVGQEAPNGTEGVEGADIKAEEAWKVSTGSKKVIVAVIDTGIDYRHPDLAANIWVNTKERDTEGGKNGKDDDGNGYPDDVYGWNFVSYARDKKYHGKLGEPNPMDDNGHGTHCAGTIGAVANNGEGIAGVNHNVSLMALKVLNHDGSGNTVDIIRAVIYAADNDADIVNASFGGGGKSKSFLAALKYAESKGTLFVAAAGNESSNNDEEDTFPTNYPVESILSVAATDNRDQLASFSNYGYSEVDIAAPGVNIMSTYPTELAAGEGDANPYRVFSGTSMATPHVVGAAALVLAATPDLKDKPLDLKLRLMETVDYKAHLAGKVRAGGRLNLANAVNNKVTQPIIEQKWIEQPLALSTTSFPDALLNQYIPVKIEGAKALQVHIASAKIDSVDLGAIYDLRYQLISIIPQDTIDLWAPIVLGDTAVVRFSNALVTTQRVKKKVFVEDPAELEEDANCFEGSGNKWECHILDKSKEAFANFDSEGIVIDKVRYIK
jgi:thermitase